MSHTFPLRAFVPAALCCMALAPPAHAQSRYPDCAGRTPSEVDIAGAKGSHATADAYYQQGKFEKAIERWLEAYALDCTAHRLLINIGNAYVQLAGTTLNAADLEKAIDAYDTYVQRAGASADTAVKEKLANLRERVRQQRTQPPPTASPPNGGDKPPRRDNPPPPPDAANDGDAGGVNYVPWILIGAGSAAAVAGAVVWGVGLGKQSDAQDICPEVDGKRKCPQTPEGQAAQDDGDTGVLMAWVGGSIAIAGVGTAVLGLVLKLTEDDGAAPAESTAVRARPLLGPGVGGIALSGRF